MLTCKVKISIIFCFWRLLPNKDFFKNSIIAIFGIDVLAILIGFTLFSGALIILLFSPILSFFSYPMVQNSVSEMVEDEFINYYISPSDFIILVQEKVFNQWIDFGGFYLIFFSIALLLASYILMKSEVRYDV